MRILVSSMAAQAQTGGPSQRCKLLVEGFQKAGFDVATARARDCNYKDFEGVKNYNLKVPSPLGIPDIIGSKIFPIAQKIGINRVKTVRSFDEVLFLTGNLAYSYLKESVNNIREVIRDFKPDLVYSEFNLGALIAARVERVPCFTTVSQPTQHEFAHKSRLAKGLNRLLEELGLETLDSALELFSWANEKFCPSIKELEPEFRFKVNYCGSLKKIERKNLSRNKILVYMGNGTVSVSRTVRVVKEAFRNSPWEVYVGSSELKTETDGNIHLAPRWNFDELLEEAVCFINHGGQNSVIDGLLHGVGQIMVPGKVFERKFNAESITNNGAGKGISLKEFQPEIIYETVRKVIESSSMRESAWKLGQKLLSVGGITVMIDRIKSL